MKTLTINFKNIRHLGLTTVKSEAAMWKVLRTVRDLLVDEDLERGAKVEVRTQNGDLFKNITFRRNTKGKIIMPNTVKETSRYAVEKAKKINRIFNIVHGRCLMAA